MTPSLLMRTPLAQVSKTPAVVARPAKTNIHTIFQQITKHVDAQTTATARLRAYHELRCFLNVGKRISKRELFPNHGARWTENNRTDLMQMFSQKTDAAEMSNRLGRDRSAIDFEIAKCLIEQTSVRGASVQEVARTNNRTEEEISAAIDVAHRNKKMQKLVV